MIEVLLSLSPDVHPSLWSGGEVSDTASDLPKSHQCTVECFVQSVPLMLDSSCRSVRAEDPSARAAGRRDKHALDLRPLFAEASELQQRGSKTSCKAVESQKRAQMARSFGT